mgnify:CR=1 FL=1
MWRRRGEGVEQLERNLARSRPGINAHELRQLSRAGKSWRDFTVRVKFKTEVVDGRRRIVDDPPIVEHLPDLASENAVHTLLDRYASSLQEDRRNLLDRFEVIDVARKVVGVGSVGTVCGVGLFMAADDDPLFLQVKEARASVLEPYAGKSLHANHGQRVVELRAIDAFSSRRSTTGVCRRRCRTRRRRPAT